MSSGIMGALQSASGPIAKKVLSSLGFGVVSYAAIIAALEGVKTAVIASYGAISGDIAAILSLAGFGQAIGIILGALTARLTYAQLNKLQILTK
jgi:rhodanese-related sulfurtransferase